MRGNYGNLTLNARSKLVPLSPDPGDRQGHPARPDFGDADARHLRGLGALLDKRLLGALVLSEDPRARKLYGGILALPAAWALGSE